ncbi:GntR family transcriptional regulator [Euzebya sp.]|uniref:GntR family transcriptional regulator n=1 Tax=Euzebya sp. TaxID=1971409 RepID=UPI003511929D
MTTFDSLKPLTSAPTSAVIADRITEAIMSGSVESGSRLDEAQLATRLGVSRGPIREALQRLVAQGLLVSHRGRGTFVATLDLEDVIDVYRCRAVTEGAAIRLLMAAGDADAIAVLEDAVDRLAEAARGGEWHEITEVDLRFHESLVAAAGSKRLVRMFSTLLVETRMCLIRLRTAYPVPEHIVPQHRHLVAAIKEGDEARALELVQEHMDRAVALQVDDATFHGSDG